MKFAQRVSAVAFSVGLAFAVMLGMADNASAQVQGISPPVATAGFIEAAGQWNDVAGPGVFTIRLPVVPDGPITATGTATNWPCGNQWTATGTKRGNVYELLGQMGGSCAYVTMRFTHLGNKITGTMIYSGYRGGSDVDMTITPN
ncbi:MAG: hypothetical protein Q7S95_03655 [bacterium]|nr:hypothetical protein [bacterium]